MKTYKQLDLFAQCDIVNPAISAEQYQLQHAHSNILKKPLDEVPAGGKKPCPWGYICPDRQLCTHWDACVNKDGSNV